MNNEIEHIRTEVRKFFNQDNKLNVTHLDYSENGLYYYTKELYKQDAPDKNWIVCKVIIRDRKTDEKIMEYITNFEDKYICACWISKNGNDYLFLPEALEGQSVVDISQRQLYSFYSQEDTFTWKSIYPSMDRNKIAVDGFLNDGTNELRVYDIADVTQLPYRLLYKETNFIHEAGCSFELWENNNTIVFCQKGRNLTRVKV
ncbi:MAG: hypothetical protein LBQ60_13365 [Bacteroidales bacterium]|jgi:hypothetical protein|nr:hypothetical protein [Bacteroidales bacterium]